RARRGDCGSLVRLIGLCRQSGVIERTRRGRSCYLRPRAFARFGWAAWARKGARRPAGWAHPGGDARSRRALRPRHDLGAFYGEAAALFGNRATKPTGDGFQNPALTGCTIFPLLRRSWELYGANWPNSTHA